MGGGRWRKDQMVALAVVGVLAGVAVFANRRILAKAGYPPALALLSPISPVNLVLLLAFAFQEWPLERELRLAREAAERPSPRNSEPAT